jgi:hypothetical protein
LALVVSMTAYQMMVMQMVMLSALKAQELQAWSLP